MKKLLTIPLALALTLSLAACGGGNTPASAPSSAAPSSSTASVANTASAPESTAAPTADSPYKLQVEIAGAKEAIFAISGVSAGEKNPNGEQRRWEVIAGQYCIQLKDDGDGVLKCQGGFQNTSGSWDYPYKQSYSLDGNTLYLQASLQETDIDFNKIEQFELQVKEPSGYTTASIPAADVIVDKLELPNTSTSTSSSASNPTTPASDEVKPIGEFYNDADELLTIAESNISFKNDGNDYSVDYPSTAPEVVDNTMKKLAFTANGSQIELYYRPADFTLNQTKSIQITIDGKPSKYMSRAKGNISAIAGTYKGQSDDVLTVSSDGTFKFSSSKTGTITGVIPAGHKSGDKITAGEYEITLHYGSNNSGMSVDVRSADGNPVIGTDMVRS